MTSEKDETTPQPAGETAAVSGIGRTLAEAREKLGMSIEEAAQQLRLGPRQLQALENDDYASLPGVTFVRGFLRNYARLLHLDPEPLLQALPSNIKDTAQQSISLHSEKITLVQRGKRPWLRYAIASVLIGGAFGGWMAYLDYSDRQPVSQAARTPVPVSAKPLPAEAAKPGNVQGAPAVAARSEIVVESPPHAATDNVRLSFKFSERTWMSITDRNGTEIFNKNKAPGSEDWAEGLPPFAVTIGNASGVQIVYNGKPVDITPYIKANIARFTLE